jgi:hypothetical protein
MNPDSCMDCMDWGLIPGRAKIFLFTTTSRSACYLMGSESSFPEGIATDLSLLSSAEVKNTLPALPHTLQGCIQKFPDWPPRVRTVNDTTFCH